jgi:hypothetical protein
MNEKRASLVAIVIGTKSPPSRPDDHNAAPPDRRGLHPITAEVCSLPENKRSETTAKTPPGLDFPSRT